MAGIALIASYLRSGNNWVRVLLGNAIYVEIRSSQQLAGNNNAA
jgi:hypothetical protein